MRIRDTFKYFCDTCWVMFILLTCVWALFAFISVVGFFAGGPAHGSYWIWVGITALLGIMIVWVAYSEARSHYKYDY